MAYTLHFRCSKQDLLPWAFQDIGNPFESVDYRLVDLSTHVWNFDIVFANKDQSQDFLVKLMSNSLPGRAGEILAQIKKIHPTAQEHFSTS